MAKLDSPATVRRSKAKTEILKPSLKTEKKSVSTKHSIDQLKRMKSMIKGILMNKTSRS